MVQMKPLYKSICLLLFLSLALLCFSAGASAQTFSDLPPGDPCYKAVEKLVEEGSISGYPDGTFRAAGKITRAELVSVINRVFDYNAKAAVCSFSDVKAGSWYYKFVLQAELVGYVKGYPDGTFLPDGNVTKEEACAFINRLVKLPIQHRQTEIPINDAISGWAKTNVESMIWNGVWNTDANGCFYGKTAATRGEVCMVLAQFAANTPPVDQKAKIFHVLLKLNNNVLPLCNEGQKNVVLQMINSMEQYMFDTRFDYHGAANKAMEDYALLPETERQQLKNWIATYNTLSELRDLAQFFFPEIKF